MVALPLDSTRQSLRTIELTLVTSPPARLID
jgi:hypothetical protein